MTGLGNPDDTDPGKERDPDGQSLNAPEMLEGDTIMLTIENRNGLELKLREYESRVGAFGKADEAEVTDWDEDRKKSFSDALYKKLITDAVLKARDTEELAQAQLFNEVRGNLKGLA